MKLFSPKKIWNALFWATAVAVTVAVMTCGASTGFCRSSSHRVTPTAQVTLRPTGTVILYGTSTLHDWDMTAKQLQGSAQFELGSNGELAGLTAMTFILPVHNLKGDKDGLNDNAWEALKADKFKNIQFTMTSARIDAAAAGKYTIHANGNLTIAGTTKPIAMDVKAQVNADGSVTCTGTYALKMSEYNIDRPSFMFGAMKAGDALTLSYSLVFVK